MAKLIQLQRYLENNQLQENQKLFVDKQGAKKFVERFEENLNYDNTVDKHYMNVVMTDDHFNYYAIVHIIGVQHFYVDAEILNEQKRFVSKEAVVRAVFQGKDGDLGYKRAAWYTLKISTRPSIIFEDKRMIIHVEREEGGGEVEYEHIENGFFDNWGHISKKK